MDAMQQNAFVMALVVSAAAVLTVVVTALFSPTLRQQGLRRLVKRWLGR